MFSVFHWIVKGNDLNSYPWSFSLEALGKYCRPKTARIWGGIGSTLKWGEPTRWRHKEQLPSTSSSAWRAGHWVCYTGMDLTFSDSKRISKTKLIFILESVILNWRRKVERVFIPIRIVIWHFFPFLVLCMRQFLSPWRPPLNKVTQCSGTFQYLSAVTEYEGLIIAST